MSPCYTPFIKLRTSIKKEIKNALKPEDLDYPISELERMKKKIPNPALINTCDELIGKMNDRRNELCQKQAS